MASLHPQGLFKDTVSTAARENCRPSPSCSDTAEMRVQKSLPEPIESREHLIDTSSTLFIESWIEEVVEG